MSYTLELAPDLLLTEFRPSDAEALVEHLHNQTIYRWTLRIPYPYTPADAEKYLAHAIGGAEEFALDNLAIRRHGKLVGGCGLQRCDEWFATHRAELGYWVAPACWGQGIATLAVGALCRQARAAGKLEKLTAWVFGGNQRSARVVEKNGFSLIHVSNDLLEVVFAIDTFPVAQFGPHRAITKLGPFLAQCPSTVCFQLIPYFRPRRIEGMHDSMDVVRAGSARPELPAAPRRQTRRLRLDALTLGRVEQDEFMFQSFTAPLGKQWPWRL